MVYSVYSGYIASLKPPGYGTGLVKKQETMVITLHYKPSAKPTYKHLFLFKYFHFLTVIAIENKQSI